MTTVDEVELEKMVYYIVRHYGRYHLGLEDQLQEARKAAYQAIQACDKSQEHGIQWNYIFQYVKSYLCKHNRKEYRWRAAERENGLDRPVSGGQEVEAEKRMVLAAIDRLPPVPRELVRAELQGEHWKVTAERLGLGRNGLNQQKRRAMNSLRAILAIGDAA